MSPDNKSLVFGTQGLYGAASQPLATAAEFDKLNTDKSRNPNSDVLSRSEIIQGAYEILLKSNTNRSARIYFSPSSV